MSGLRFLVTLVSLLLLFVGGGYLIDHRGVETALPPVAERPQATATVVAETPAPAAAPTPAADAEILSDRALAPVEAAETRTRKEFDTTAADAAAEAETKAAAETQAAATTPATSNARSIALTPDLVTLDTAQLSASVASVIAGKAPAGTEVTLLGNDTALGKAMADESGTWMIVIEEGLAPDTYKLKLAAVAATGGAAISRDAGEVTVRALVEATTDPAAATPTTSVTAATTPAPAAPEVFVPAAANPVTGVPPDLAATPAGSPAVPATMADATNTLAASPAAGKEEASATAPAEATVATPEAAVPETGDPEAVQPAPASSNPATSPAQASEQDNSLTTQAGEVADTSTQIFTDWQNATKEQAEEAAKTFTLASAAYKATAKDEGVVTLSGRGPAKAEVQVAVDGRGIGATEIAESGRWLIEVPRVLVPGEHTGRAEIVAADGTLIAGHDLRFTSAPPPEMVAIAPSASGEAEAPAALPAGIPLVVSDVTYQTMGDQSGRVTVNGRAAPGATITVGADGKTIGTATADPAGSWTLASDTWLAAGAHAIRVEIIAASGEVVERALSEFVRLPTGLEVAAAAPPEEPATTVADATEAAPESVGAKPRKRRAGAASRKRLKLAARVRKADKRHAAKQTTRPKPSGYRIVNVIRGKTLSRVRVRMPGRKGRVVSYMVPQGPGWVRVRRGDTLWRIADHWYGDGHSFPVIAGFNAARVPEPDRVRTHQRLRVP